MPVYQKRLTTANSAFINTFEPNIGQTGSTWFVVGNKPDGIGAFVLLKKPDDFPSGLMVINSAKLQLTLMDYDGYSSDTLNTIRASRITGAWNAAAKMNSLPVYDSAVYGSLALENDIPDSGQYSFRVYHAAQYKYRKYYFSGVATDDYVNTTEYKGTSYTASGWVYKLVSTVSAYYDYYKYREIDIAGVVEDMVASGATGIILYFDLPGTNDNRKYFKSPANSDERFQPMITIDYSTDFDPDAPTLDTIASPITTDTNEFAITDANAAYSYEWQFSDDDGTTWKSTVLESAVGVGTITADLRAYFGMTATQYYNNATVKVRVRAKYGANYSELTESDAFTIAYAADPDPQAPAAWDGSTITESPYTFLWPAGEDANLVVAQEALTYEMKISLDGGATYGAAQATTEGQNSKEIDLRAYLGIGAQQYYYNANVVVAVRTVATDDEETAFYSEWTESGAYTIAFASPAPTPVYADENNIIDAYWWTPETDFGVPNANKTLTDIYFYGWGTKADGTAGGQVKITAYYNRTGVLRTKEKVVTLATSRKPHHLGMNATGRIFKFKIENISGSAINISGLSFVFEVDKD